MLDDASCAFQLVFGHPFRPEAHHIFFSEMKYWQGFGAAHALRQLDGAFLADDAGSLAVETHNITFVHLVSIPQLLVFLGKVFEWKKMVATVTEDVGIIGYLLHWQR